MPATHHTADPRIGWGSTPGPGDGSAPVPLHRRDGIMPTTAAALSVRGTTLTCAGGKSATPPTHHPLVQDFLDTLTSERRERHTGRCPEAVLLTRYLTSAEADRSKRAARKPFTAGDARRALKHAKLTTRRIREQGDPWHGTYAPPCRSCAALLDHFGVRAVEPTQVEPA
ncbi:YwqJ-related putative deaminase [Streptomyces sp. TRM70308]|uniref:YwqJ-related putative deaminase n=1 Tax=Streptomyces sp. TRM70308 TaxID=3131932 RepID=UPI003D043D99